MASAPGEHAILFVASTNREALDGIIQGDPGEDRYGFRSLGPEAVGPSASFVQIRMAYVMEPDLMEIPPLPRDLDPGAFTVTATEMGAPLHELIGRGSDRGIFSITYWIGPDAPREVHDETAFVIRELRLPAPGEAG